MNERVTRTRTILKLSFELIWYPTYNVFILKAQPQLKIIQKVWSTCSPSANKDPQGSAHTISNIYLGPYQLPTAEKWQLQPCSRIIGGEDRRTAAITKDKLCDRKYSTQIILKYYLKFDFYIFYKIVAKSSIAIFIAWSRLFVYQWSGIHVASHCSVNQWSGLPHMSSSRSTLSSF